MIVIVSKKSENFSDMIKTRDTGGGINNIIIDKMLFQFSNN